MGSTQLFFEFIDLTVEDLHETLIHYGLSDVHIVASSSSAIIATVFCNRYPNLVKSLTMSGLTPVKTSDWDEIFGEDLEHKKKILDNPEADQYFKQLHVKNDWKKFVSLVIEADWYPHQLVSDLSKLSEIPTLILAGEQVGPEVKGISYYKEKYKHIHVAILPFAGHLIHRDQPDLFNKIIAQFLKNLEVEAI